MLRPFELVSGKSHVHALYPEMSAIAISGKRIALSGSC